jgi:hypothetical protein
MHHDLLRVAAQRVAVGVRRRAVVGADHAVAVILQSLVALGTVLAAIDDAADADQIAWLESAHALANSGHAADDLMARYAGI